MIRATFWQLSGREHQEKLLQSFLAICGIVAIWQYVAICRNLWQSVAIWQYVAIFMETSTAVHCDSRGAAAIPAAPAFASLPFAGMVNSFPMQ